MKHLCFDYGSRRIGIAVSDPTGMIVRPLCTIDTKETPRYLDTIATLFEQESPEIIVFGLPLGPDSEETATCKKVRSFQQKIYTHLSCTLPFYFMDESFSTVRTQDILLRTSSKKRRAQKKTVDQIAACVILKTFFVNKTTNYHSTKDNSMGTLYLVATPVGNLDDISLRAIKTLTDVTAILAEDTRVTGKLLKHLAIETPMKSYHDHNKEKVTAHYIDLLMGDSNLALVTDAGTPGIADPAFYIVREAIAHTIPVVAIPGATAFVPALITSGLPSDRCIFENFLPPKSSKRLRFFSEMESEKRTVIFYESPHRILKVLAELGTALPGVPVVLCREITKMYEEILRGTPESLLLHYAERKPKGEMVVLFNNSIRDKWTHGGTATE